MDRYCIALPRFGGISSLLLSNGPPPFHPGSFQRCLDVLRQKEATLDFHSAFTLTPTLCLGAWGLLLITAFLLQLPRTPLSTEEACPPLTSLMSITGEYPQSTPEITSDT